MTITEETLKRAEIALCQGVTPARETLLDIIAALREARKELVAALQRNEDPYWNTPRVREPRRKQA